MWFLWALSWVASIIQIVLLTLSVATGLFYLAELVEEYASTACRVIRYMIYGTLLVYIGLLLFEDMSYSLIICGIIQQVLHFMLLSSFPFFSFSSPTFVGTCVMLGVNHYLVFSYFRDVWHPFSEVLAVFTVCLWLVPFAFFVSLSANDNTLPSVNPESRNLLVGDKTDLLDSYFSAKNKRVGLLSALKGAQEWVGLSFKNKKTY